MISLYVFFFYQTQWCSSVMSQSFHLYWKWLHSSRTERSEEINAGLQLNSPATPCCFFFFYFFDTSLGPRRSMRQCNVIERERKENNGPLIDFREQWVAVSSEGTAMRGTHRQTQQLSDTFSTGSRLHNVKMPRGATASPVILKVRLELSGKHI